MAGSDIMSIIVTKPRKPEPGSYAGISGTCQRLPSYASMMNSESFSVSNPHTKVLDLTYIKCILEMAK